MKNISKEVLIVISSLLILIMLSWYYLYSMSLEMGSTGMSSITMKKSFEIFRMPMISEWSLNDFIVMLLMWIIMMFAMMMPSTFIFLNVYHMMRSNMKSVRYPKFELFLLSFAYVIIWVIFSIFACTLQYYLHNQGLVDMMGMFQNKLLGGITLILAGVFQFSSLKNACLDKCRNPFSFIMGKNIRGFGDILSMGFMHGIYCLVCCWALMLLLFVNGVMNLLWIVILTIAVLAEKILPFEELTSRFFGVVLVGWGAYLTII